MIKNKILAIGLAAILSVPFIGAGYFGKVYAANTDIASRLKAGGVIPAGNYKLTKKVDVTKPVSAYGVVVDASGCPSDTIAIVAKANISGITIKNPQRQGISVQKCSNVKIKDCKVTGAQFAGIEAKDDVSNITFENCQSDYNFDNVKKGENADGFGIKNGAKNITLINCSATGNSDDGYDTYTAGSNITFIKCTASNNGSGQNGDGNGFKLGPCTYKGQNGGLVTVKNCTATNNKGWGFLRNHNKVAPVQSGNIATGNKKGQFNWQLD